MRARPSLRFEAARYSSRHFRRGILACVPVGWRVSVRRKVLSCLFFAALAGPFCLWLAVSADQPLWLDEAVTVSLVKSASLKHMFSAVLLGLDNTPPLYTGYGWFMLHHLAPDASPELLLRITNAGLVGATLWILYLLVCQYFGQITALTTIATFILLELWHLKFLTLEIRTYAALVFFTTLTIYAALHSIARPSWMSLICTTLAYCLLVSSHTFGIIYVVCIMSCAMVAAAAEGNIRLALNSGLTAVPAIIMFFLWVPVLQHQAQLGSWIPRPNFFNLLGSTYPPELRHGMSLLAILLLLAALSLLWRSSQSRKGPTLTQWWRSTNRLQTFAILLPITFVASTLTVWLFSRLLFPVFIERYFFPNIILHIIWLSVLVDFIFTYLSPTTRYGLALAAAVLAGLSIEYRQFDRGNRIHCFNSSRKVYLEDPFKDKGLIVANGSHPWLTRQNRPGEVAVFPIDEDAQKKNGTKYPTYVYNKHFVETFAKWLGVNTVMTTSQLLNTKPGFMVLDEGWGSWFEYIQQSHKVKLTSLAEMEGCTLWWVEVIE